jgi:hypothetical protein
LTYKYLEDGVETNEEELYVGDDEACSSINNSIFSALDIQVPERWPGDQ